MRLWLVVFSLISLSVEASLKEVPLVFVHGFKGATLLTPHGSEAWLTIWESLGLSSADLKLPLKWNEDGQAKDDLVAGEILRDVSLIPCVIGKQVYGPWLNKAKDTGRPFYPFAYDWRRANEESVTALGAFLEKIVATHHSPVQVVAHSMGGLVTLSLLNRRPELFHSVVFVGVPFGGGIGLLPDLQGGVPVGLNHRILSPEVEVTFSSIYSLFPDHSEALLTREGKPQNVDFFDAAEWKKWKLAWFSRPDEIPADFPAYLETALQKAKAFRETLKAKPQKYPPIKVVLAKTFPTLRQAIQDGPKAERGWDFESAPKGGGDGLVLEEVAVPPEAIPYTRFYVERRHSDLLNGPELPKILEN